MQHFKNIHETLCRNITKIYIKYQYFINNINVMFQEIDVTFLIYWIYNCKEINYENV